MLLIFGIQTGSIFFNSSQLLSDSTDISTTEYMPRIAAPHDPILIRNESELLDFVTDESLMGSGSVDDPYVIENMEISEIRNDTKNAAFYIGNTRSYIRIQNVIIANAITNQSYAWCLKLENCSNIEIDTLSIRHILNQYHPTPGYLFGFSCYESNQIEVSTVVIENCFADRIYHIDFYECDAIILTDIISQHSQALNYSSGFSFYYTTNTEVSNCIFLNQSLSDTYQVVANSIFGFYISESENLTITQCEFSEIKSQNTNLFGRISNCQYIDIVNNQWKDIQGDYFGFTITDTESCVFSENTFKNIQATLEGYIFYCPDNVNNNLFSSNIFQDIEAPLCHIFFFDHSDGNILSKNQMMGEMNGEAISFATLTSNTANNRIYSNYILNVTTDPARDDGSNNEWTVLAYFEPLQIMTMVGNYWCTHNLDEEGTLHYFVANAYNISGTASSQDTQPLHYFGLDFDQDGVINYYEQYYQLDCFDADSDNDGIGDYEEIDWWHGDLIDEDPEETPETNTTTEDDTNTTTTATDSNFWEKLGDDPAAIGIFGAIAVLIVIAVQGFLKKKTL